MIKYRFLSIALWAGAVMSPAFVMAQSKVSVSGVETQQDFKMIPLPYQSDALAPVISKQTIELHYGKHLKAYLDQVNRLKKQEGLGNESLESIVLRSKGSLFNNAGQLRNHNLYFAQFSPKPKNSEPAGILLQLIQEQWGSFDSFKKSFEETGSKLFGSGWLWLSETPEGKLEISLHQGGESPILKGNRLLLGIDLWEHAYYLDYNNRRSDHLKALWSIIDWSIVGSRLK